MVERFGGPEAHFQDLSWGLGLEGSGGFGFRALDVRILVSKEFRMLDPVAWPRNVDKRNQD